MTTPLDPRATYDAHDPVENPARARKHALVRAVKRLIEATAHIDPNEADGGPVEEATTTVQRLSEQLEQLPSLHAKGGLGTVGGDDGALLERSGISGRSNPLAAPVQWEARGDHFVGWATYSPAYEGPVGHVHGGFVAAAFDDLMGSAQTLSGSAGHTGTLTVKMLRPTPLNKRIDYTAGVDHIDGRKIYVWAHAECEGERLAEAEIVFITPRDGSRPR